MKTYKNLYKKLCSLENLKLAWEKARKRKTLKQYVINFEKNLKNNLLQLRSDLLFHSYTPQPLIAFIIRDPKTRKICKSDFRDRIVHHALCNIIEPIFDRLFIYDNYANRKGKGTLNAIKRYDFFKRKVSQNGKLIKNYKNSGDARGWCLKADIYHYFDEVNHEILLKIIGKKIKDAEVLWLIKKILGNHQTSIRSVGMPLGNLTSQFFANIYLNELDQFIKQKLKIRHYLRYVDDFVILHKNPEVLTEYKEKTRIFLQEKLNLKLHPAKCRIIPLKRGVDFLGFKNFYYHKLVRKKSVRKIKRKLHTLKSDFDKKIIDYDKVYDSLEGWLAYAKHANTYKLRKKIMLLHEKLFDGRMSIKEFNRLNTISLLLVLI